MTIAEVEQLAEIQQAARVLKALEHRGLQEAAIASGWIRGFLIGLPPSDIDVSYVGPVPYTLAQEHLRDVLDEAGIDQTAWDIPGIWNATQAYGFTHIIDNFLVYYVDSIDSIYLASDGKLHDATGYGFRDAGTKTLRINMYDMQNGHTPTLREDVYICLEGCRRIVKFGWEPTPESIQRIVDGLVHWEPLSPEDKAFFYKRIRKKYAPAEFSAAKQVYDRYGWGFIFDQ